MSSDEWAMSDSDFVFLIFDECWWTTFLRFGHDSDIFSLFTNEGFFDFRFNARIDFMLENITLILLASSIEYHSKTLKINFNKKRNENIENMKVYVFNAPKQSWALIRNA